MSEKPMRVAMPLCAELVDAFRDAGLVDNKTISEGLKSGRCWFKEGEHYVGQPGAREKALQLDSEALRRDEQRREACALEAATTPAEWRAERMRKGLAK